MASRENCPRRDEGGFTILELIIVLAIIAILATIMMPKIGSMIQRANEGSTLLASLMANAMSRSAKHRCETCAVKARA